MSTRKCAQCERTNQSYQLKSTMWITGAIVVIVGFSVVTALCWMMLEGRLKGIAALMTCVTAAMLIAFLHEVIKCNWIHRDIFHFVDKEGITHRHLDSPEESEQDVVLVEHIGQFSRWFQVYKNGIAAQARVLLEETDETSRVGAPTYKLDYDEVTYHGLTVERMTYFFQSSEMIEFLARKSLHTCTDGERLGRQRDGFIGLALAIRHLVKEHRDTLGNSPHGVAIDFILRKGLESILGQDPVLTARLFQSQANAWDHLVKKAVTRFVR